MSLLLVSVRRQQLTLYKRGRAVRRYRVSTAARGVGSRMGSLKTPPGLHVIARKIGAGRHPLTIFKDRRETGRRWDGRVERDNLILGRILVLDGLEPGLNRGGRVDSRRRYIYVHGTSRVSRVGSPSSNGCITLKPSDAVDLFRRVRVGDLVHVSRS
jgi:lipoprotein-anchoring transpeptidase ErfK/SrfK